MAAGDIIFEDGTIITPADLEKLIPLITNALGSTAKDPSEYPILERLDDLTSLPVFDAAYNLGRVSILRLKGVNGKNAILRVQGDMLQWSLEGTDIWNDLYSKSELKGDPGAAANMEIGEVTSGDTPAATITGEAPNYKLNLVLVPGGKGDTGDNGKTPILASVNAQSGETASGSFTDDGVDESGNPKYILDLTLPKGQDGQPAIFEQGTTTTVDPDASASVDVLPNGETAEGNPKYILNFSIPRGQKGAPGEGAGNLLADVSAVTIGKKYLLSPVADGSSEVNMVEYTPPGNATSESAGLMTSDQFQKLEKLSPSYLSNDVTGKKVEYADDGKLLFEGKETFAVDANNELTLAGKKLSELGGGDANVINIPPDIMRLSSDSTSDEIFAVWGGQKLLLEIVKNFNKSTVYTINTIENGYMMLLYPIVEIQYEDDFNYMISVHIQIQEDAIDITTEVLEGIASANVLRVGNVINTSVGNTTADRIYLSYGGDNGLDHSDLVWNNNERYDDETGEGSRHLAYGGSKSIRLTNQGDGTKALMDDATYQEVVKEAPENGKTYGRKNKDWVEVGGDYQLPSATDSVLGGIKIGYVASEKNYPVQLDGSDKAYVNVPWTDTNTTYSPATTSSNGLMSSTDKTKLDRIGSYTTATTVANLNANYETIEISNLSANASLSVNLVGTTYNGWDINVFIYCSSARTITIPTSGNYISMIGSSLSCPAGKWTELNLHCAGGKWRIAKLEQQ